MLRSLLPRLLPQEKFSFQCIPFEGKQSLQKQLPAKLRGWQKSETSFVILHDQDRNDCKKLKEQLVRLCHDAKKPQTLIRIACRELESWYLADLNAVEQGLGVGNLARQQNKAKCRQPDSRHYPARILTDMTHGKYQKIAGSRAIGPHLDLDNTRSASFRFHRRCSPTGPAAAVARTVTRRARVCGGCIGPETFWTTS